MNSLEPNQLILNNIVVDVQVDIQDEVTINDWTEEHALIIDLVVLSMKAFGRMLETPVFCTTKVQYQVMNIGIRQDSNSLMVLYVLRPMVTTTLDDLFNT